MAEIFATASAAIGVAAAAGQLIDGVRKLRAFCLEVRDIPKDIQDAVEDLSVRLEVLDYVQAELGQDIHPVTTRCGIFARVLEYLRQSSQQVDEVLQQLQARVGKNKRWGSIQAVAMKGKLQKASSRVQNAQDLLLMTVVTGNTVLLRHNLESQQQGFNAISNLIAMAPTSSQSRDSAECHGVSDTIAKRSMKKNVKKRSNVNRVPRFATSWTLRLRFLPWLSNQAWDLNVRRARQGWDFSIRSYRIRPLDAEIFNAVRRCDLGAVRQMLSNGEASIWDRNPYGSTLLALAVSSGVMSDHGLAIVRLLVDSGADINARNFWGETVYGSLSNLVFLHRPHPSAQPRIVRMFRTFINSQDWPDALPSFSERTRLKRPENLYAFEGRMVPSEVVRLALDQVWPPWDARPLSDRFETIYPFRHKFRYARPLNVRTCLGGGSFQSLFAHCGTRTQRRIAIWALRSLSHALSYDSHQDDAEELRRMLKEMFSTDGILVTIFQYRPVLSPMVAFLELHGPADNTCMLPHGLVQIDEWQFSSLLRFRHEIRQEALKLYVCEMIELGIDMVSLGELERKAVQSHKLRRPSRVIGFKYGPTLDDWHLWVSTPLDEWAGEFWDMVERPERAMPGAWYDE